MWLNLRYHPHMIMSNRPIPERAADRPAPRFQIGQLVRHRRYGYRGVIVAFDLACGADEAWYQTNQTQPDRDQPWYHVLVHETPQTTYAAEANLRMDPSPQPVEHPLLAEFFCGFAEGRYTRNDSPWPT